MFFALLTVVAIGSAQESVQSPLQLEQVQVWDLDDRFVPSGFSYSPDGVVALDAANRQIALIHPEAGVSILRLSIRSNVIAAAPGAAGGYQVVDSLGLSEVDGSGVVLRRHPLESSSDRIVAAERIQKQWYYVLQGENVEVVCDATGSATRLEPLSIYGAVTSGQTDSTLLIVSTVPPFSIHVVDNSCNASRIAADLPVSLPTYNALDLRSSWIVVAVVPIQDAYVVSLADLRSDARLLAMVGPSGRLLRTKEIPHAFSIVGAVNGAVMAIRTLTTRQIIHYRAAMVPDVPSPALPRRPQ